MFPFTTQHVVIEFPERSKKIPTKKYIAIPVIRGRDKRLTMPEVFDGFVVNRQGAVLWCGRNLRVETAHSHLPCFALCRKTTPNKQRAAKPYKMAMNWAQVTQKKQQQTQVYVSTIYCLHRDFAQKAKSRGGTLVTRAYIKESTYSWNIQSVCQKKSRFAWTGAARNR